MYYTVNTGKTLSRCRSLYKVERPCEDLLLFEEWKDLVKTYYSLNSGKTLCRSIGL